MRRFERSAKPGVDSLESKVVPTTIAPLPQVGIDQAVGAEVGRFIVHPMAITRDTVRIQNATGFHIHVTARLMVPDLHKPTIARQIRPNGGVDAFSFGRHRDDFIEVTIQRVGSHTPRPLTTTLNKPISGYYGAMFRVNTIGDSFTVTG